LKNIEYDFIHYLAAKKKIDDRALNRHVLDKLSAELPKSNLQSPLQVLELGAGIGTMVERLIDWELFSSAEYTAVDADPNNIREALTRLNCRAAKNHLHIHQDLPATAGIQTTTGQLSVTFICDDIFHIFKHAENKKQWDLGLAHAFLDLVDIADVVPRFCRSIKPGGLVYLTLNYDGETIFLPAVDRKFDERIMQLYNQSMDERTTNGKTAGDSKTGRHLLLHLKKAGAEILAAGSSDWIVFPASRGYTNDETYFLHYLVHTIFTELEGRTSLNRQRLDAWARQQHMQIENSEMIFIAKQLDVLARIREQ
jgi:SAM-dependent methyltransferase